MNIIVTGASGFLGKKIADYLLGQSNVVFTVSRNIESKVCERHIPLIGAENEFEKVIGEFGEGYFDCIVHLAWSGTSGPLRGNTNCQIQNIKYSSEVANASVKYGVKKFLFFGSIMEKEVDYENPSESQIYNIAKECSNKLCKMICLSNNVEYISLCISNIYGPGEVSERFINSMLRKMRKNEHIYLSSCEQKYDFIHVDDAVKIIYKIMINGRSGECYYVGNREQRELKYFVEIMKEVTNSESTLTYSNITPKEINYVALKTDMVEREFGVEALRSFKQGIINMIEEE